MYCPECGDKLQFGDTEADKYNITRVTMYYCDKCELRWDWKTDHMGDSTIIIKQEGKYE